MSAAGVMNGAWLVTGGSGLIGAALLQRLRAERPRQAVWLAGRAPSADAASSPGPACQRWPLDLAAPELELPAGVHTVLHLAGEKRDAALMPAVNHEGARRLVEAAARAGAQRFVHLSSVGVYGAPRHAGLVTESHAHTPRGAYETSKDAGEQAVRQRCAALGLACTVLQPSNVIGLVPGRHLPLLGLVRQVARGWFRQFGRGQAWVNYVAVDDVAAALLQVAQDERAAGCYIVNTPARLESFVGWVADELGLAPPRARLPLWVGAAAAVAGEVAGRLRGRPAPFDRARFGELTNTTRYEGQALQRATGFTYPLGIEAELRALTQRYRAMGLV